MKIFNSQEVSMSAKAKDSVLRLLYAYEKYKDIDGKKGALSFKKNLDFVNHDRDIENAITTINIKADFAYMKSIIDFLSTHDYIQKLAELKDENVNYYMLTKSGALFYENNGFEKELKDQRQLNSENYYKILTIILALVAIASPIVNERLLKTNTNDKIEKLGVTINELTLSMEKMKLQNSNLIRIKNDTLSNHCK